MCEGNTENRNERNIMIMFLSNLHGKWNEEKTELRWNSEENEYAICQSSQTAWCMETNEAPLKEVLTTIGKPLDAIFYFSTKQVGMYPPHNGAPLKKRITISFPPHHTASKSYDSEAHFFWTVRAKEVAGDLLTEKTRIVPVPFDDEGKGNFVGEAISAVRMMESAIKQYLKDESVPLNNCYLYADITGGKRTANMAMSAVIQLLQYEGVHLRRVVYSDYDQNRKGENGASPIHPVGNVQPIHDMHRLVAGVDAFEKYGSSAALNDFFKDEIKPGQEYEPLATLLSAMDKFSEAVLLCQPGSIETHLKSLVDALEKFPPREKEPRPAKVELLARMIDNLQEKYKPMYHTLAEGGLREVDKLEVIKWCVKNTLLQPAVTFCVEWLPEYFEEHGIAYTDDPIVQAYCKSGEFEGYRSGRKNFLMQFCTKSPAEATSKEPEKTGLRKLEEFAQLLNMPFSYDGYDYFEEHLYYHEEHQAYRDMGRSCWGVASISHEMLNCGMMRTDCDVKDAIGLIRDYTYIRTELRNKMNHASEGKKQEGKPFIKIKIGAIKPYLASFLARVERQKEVRHEMTGLWREDARVNRRER